MDSALSLQPVLIRRQSDLQALAARLAKQPALAVDTESNSLYAYQEQVCLIQFSTPDEDILVDPLALEDISALAPLFADPAIEKVFHAAEYDLIGLGRDFGFSTANLFDTMHAARVLGREAVGLGALLEVEFGISLDKRFQRADWGQRPLPAPLLAYARLDTHYLLALRQRMESELVERNLLPLAQEDFARLCQQKNGENGRSAAGRSPAGEAIVDCWRVSGSYDLQPRQAAVLLELCRYRDKAARALNRPLFKVIGDQTLLAMAEQPPADLDGLREIPGMSPRQIQRHGQHLLQALQRGQQAAPIYPPRHPRPDERLLVRLDLLRRWRKETGEELHMASDIILPRDLLYSLAENNPTTPEALAEQMQDVPWRLEHFGEQILQVLARRKQK